MTDRNDRDREWRPAIGADLLTEGLDSLALEIVAKGFSALWHFEARRPHELAYADPHRIDEAITTLVARGRCQLDSEGRLVGIHGLTLTSRHHHFLHEGRTHHTWCAFDTVGIPAALEIDATAITNCPTCRRQLRVQLTAGVPIDSDRLALWLPAPNGDHLMTSFCANADLYCSVEHLKQRIDTKVNLGEITDLIQAATLGRYTWSDIANLGTTD